MVQGVLAVVFTRAEAVGRVVDLEGGISAVLMAAEMQAQPVKVARTVPSASFGPAPQGHSHQRVQVHHDGTVYSNSQRTTV